MKSLLVIATSDFEVMEIRRSHNETSWNIIGKYSNPHIVSSGRFDLPLVKIEEEFAKQISAMVRCACWY